MTFAAPFRLAVVGRLAGVTRGRLAEAATRQGGRLVGAVGRADVVALAHGSAATVLAGGVVPVVPGLVAGTAIVSERSLRRALGLAADDTEEEDAVRTLGAGDVARAAGITQEVLGALALYDVVGPPAEPMAFRDVVAAREAGRLIAEGLPLSAVVDAAVRLRRHGRSLAGVRLAETAWGILADTAGGRLGTLDGQLLLALGDVPENVDEVFAAAETAERDGNLASAERLYRRAAAIDPADPTVPFNLGNVLDALGRPDEAAAEWRRALSRDPAFAEAWLNLAVLAEERGRGREADRCYLAALAARPGYREAAWSRALYLTRAGRRTEAEAAWRGIAAGDDPADARAARRMLALLGQGQSPT